MEERTYNGHDDEEADLALRDLERIANRDTKSIAVIEAVHPELPPFEQASHDLMLKSVDKIADAWVSQLKAVRANTQVIEQMVITAVNKAKHNLTELHLLGIAAQKEAKRSEEVCEHLATKIEELMAGQR